VLFELFDLGDQVPSGLLVGGFGDDAGDRFRVRLPHVHPAVGEIDPHAILGVELPLQLVVAGVVAVAATMVAHKWRGARVPPPTPSLDLGQSVRVIDWKDDGTARVNYRGTQWNAELADEGASRAETMYIVGTRGSTLVIADRRA